MSKRKETLQIEDTLLCMCEKERIYGCERVSWSIDRYQSSYEALKTDIEDNTVSVDDINDILIKMNNRFNGTIFKTVFFVVFVLILVAICKFALQEI